MFFSREELERLITVRKFVQKEIRWSPQNSKLKTKYIFSVQIISENGHSFLFEGNYIVQEKKIKSLALVHSQKFPLVRVDRATHTNPKELGGQKFTLWHKHEYDPIYEDDVARDVSDEFTNTMSPDECVRQFMIENNIVLPDGIGYQSLMETFL